MNGKELAAAIGVTYRQVDFWTSKGYLRPVEAHPGSGYQRQYDAHETRVAYAIARLVDFGLLPHLAAAIARGNAA